MRDFPVLYVHEWECCGCSACWAACSRNAITMTPDTEGFLYPVINPELCIQCYKCMKVCPFKQFGQDG